MKNWKSAACTAIRFRTRRKEHAQARAPEAGFTLMELLVVLAILGLLAAIATPMVLHYLDAAKLSTAKTEVSNLEASLDLYKYDVGSYPSTEQGLQALLTAPQGVDNWNGPYVKKTAKLTDPWGNPYKYKDPGDHGDYDIYSYGPHPDEAKNDTKPPVASW
ncbi:MAG: type II secretion system major pseudopilin GspG [Rhizomicrobium sp.]